MAQNSSGARRTPPTSDYLTRQQVLELLRIKPQTLYAYVSRGLIHSIPQPHGRSSYYFQEDVERMRLKSSARSGFGAVAASALNWGAPVITTAITQITDAGPRYRGRLALDLARANAPFESVADFLWDGTWIDRPAGWVAPDTPPQVIKQLSQSIKVRRNPHVVQLLILAVGLLGVSHGSMRERTQSAAAPVVLARQAIRTLAGVFGFLGPHHRFVALRSADSIAAGLARAMGIESTPVVRRALNAALVLDMDHELASSTFVARIAASGAADLHACIGAALNTHHSEMVGNRADTVEALFGLRADVPAVIAQVRDMLNSAQRVPGFDYPFYPNGDPRAAVLIEIARELGRSKPTVRRMLKITEVLKSEFDIRPSFELGSVMLCRALGLPPQAASGLRSLARSAGWVAHVLEQRLAGFMIRPRAKYIGPGNPA